MGWIVRIEGEGGGRRKLDPRRELPHGLSCQASALTLDHSRLLKSYKQTQGVRKAMLVIGKQKGFRLMQTRASWLAQMVIPDQIPPLMIFFYIE